MQLIMKNIYLFPLILVLLCFSFRAFAPNPEPSYDYEKIQKELLEQYQLKCELEYLKKVDDFKYALAIRESDNDWKKYNPYGYIGKFQFGKAALEVTGYGHVDFYDFLDNPAIFPEKDQDLAMVSLLNFNEFILRSYIENYVGEIFMDSIRITRTGLLAASHLAGPSNVKRFLTTNGKHNPSDHLGTRLSDYLFTFGEQYY